MYAYWRKEKKYEVGKPAPELLVTSITDDEKPVAHLGSAALLVSIIDFA